MKLTKTVALTLSLLALTLVALICAGCANGNGAGESEPTFDFEDGEQGWVAGFADLPADVDPEFYELESSWEPLPSPLEGHGIYIQGHNHSDDLFMFLKKQMEGLEPEAAYQATFAIDLATNVPEGLMGIGGSPGDSVYVKAGTTTIEPEVVEDAGGVLRMNIDKGQQSNGGEDMIVLGTIAYTPESPEDAGQWQIKSLDSAGQPFSVTSDGDGKVWFIAGTDSGFEGLTAVYYDKIAVDLTAADGD
jgi:hypothetical protein